MLLALVLGKAQGKNLSENIKKNKTNVEIDSYEDISEYCNTAIIRHRLYDRVIILGAKCTSNEINTLYDYWYTKTPRETDLVVLGKSKVDEPKCKEFLTVFNTPKAATLLVDTVTLSILMQAVSTPVTQIQAKYGIQIERETELDSGIDLGFGQKEEPKKEQHAPTPVEQPKQTVPQHKKKRSLLGAIFGTNNETEEVTPTQTNTSENQGFETVSNNGFETVPNQGFETVPNQGFESVPNNEFDSNSNMIGFDQIPSNMMNFEPIQQPTESIPNQFEQEKSNFIQNTEEHSNGFDNIPNIIEQTQPSFTEKPTEDNSNDFENIQNEFVGFELPNETELGNQEPIQNMDFEQQPIPNVNPTNEDVFDQIDDLTFDGFMQPDKDNIPLEQKNPLDQIDELEFSGFTATSIPIQEQPQQVIDTSLDLNGINTAQAETQYRQKIEQPKVITKTVVKPVLGGDGGLSVINNIKQGKLHKVLIVTGDRGSGVTSASLSIARHFAKYTDVLYFDCDNKNHGILNYLDYVKLQDFEELQLAGTHACKSNREFPNCVIPYDDNLYLLTSDFSVDVSDGDLQCTQRVIASQYTNYSLTVVDCPMINLHLLQDLFLLGDAIFCVEVSARGIMNFLCQSTEAGLDDRYARTLVSKGTIFETKLTPKVDSDSLFNYYKSIYEPEAGETNWLDMDRYKFNGKIDERILNKVLER